MSNPKISVIIPVYNAEATLRRCVDSVLSQTFTDFECLLINDGSKDRSGEICDEYAAKDSRVRVFHKENGGVSSARNVGLDNMRGEWVTFVDSDDYIQDGFLDYLMSSEQADLIIGSAIAVNGSDIRTYTNLGYLPEGYFTLESSIIQDYLTSTEFKVPWGKLFRRSLLSKLRFDIGMKVGEDAHFILLFLKLVYSIRILQNDCSSDKSYVYISPIEPFESKYKMTVRDAVYHTIKSNIAYEALGIKSKAYEIQLAQSGYELCIADIKSNGYLWYYNHEIEKICLRRSRNLGLHQFVRTWISFRLINRIRFYGKL